MARCLKYDEDECIGHDCIDRVGTPCMYDLIGVAGTEDLPEDDEHYSDPCLNDDIYAGLRSVGDY